MAVELLHRSIGPHQDWARVAGAGHLQLECLGVDDAVERGGERRLRQALLDHHSGQFFRVFGVRDGARMAHRDIASH